MANGKPWDLPPFPTGGDLSKDITFAAVGRVICEWEAVEFGFSRVHSVFCNDPDGEALRFYGKGNIFRERLAIFRKGADDYFIAHCNQDLEGRFKRLSRAAEGFADRRNEVAHGIVMAASNIEIFRTTMGLKLDEPRYALMPPYYQIRQHGIDGMPAYAYNAAKLDTLHRLLVDLKTRTERFRRSVIAVKR